MDVRLGVEGENEEQRLREEETREESKGSTLIVHIQKERVQCYERGVEKEYEAS